jgi:hypothetical protein
MKVSFPPSALLLSFTFFTTRPETPKEAMLAK